MNEDQIHEAMTTNGFSESRRTKKVVEFRSSKNRKIVYFERKVGMPTSAKMVLHPEDNLSVFDKLPGIETDGATALHHHSNMTAFPKKLNTGQNMIPYGRSLKISGIAAFPSFAAAFHAL